ncbi:MAG: hypothetical protein LQ352_007987, partial [Teloschistes flavicans]
MRHGLCALRRTSTLIFRRSRPSPSHWIANGHGAFPLRSYASVAAADLQFGQPVHETHAHLLKAGEITPGITALEYAQRRSNLASKLPQNGIAILAAADVKYRSGAVFYDYHQESNFFYLTEAVAIIGKLATQDDHTFHLFVRPKSPKEEQWEGSRSGTQAALDVFNADESGDINNIENHLSQIAGEASEVYTDALPSNLSTSTFARLFSSRPSSVTNDLSKILEKAKVKPLKSIMNDLRNIKSDSEIANMRKAGQASGRAFTEAMRQAWILEKDLTAYLEYMFKRKGCETSAYVPVVAGGKVLALVRNSGRRYTDLEQNASQIHYVRNDDVLIDGDLVLADAGGEYGNYITDITRTWPIDRTFTPPQKDLYNAILSTQRTCISLCRASASNSLDKIHQVAESTLKDSLSSLGFDMSGNALETLFPHHLGHYIGLDVHDTPGQSRKAPLQAGQCVT